MLRNFVAETDLAMLSLCLDVRNAPWEQSMVLLAFPFIGRRQSKQVRRMYIQAQSWNDSKLGVRITQVITWAASNRNETHDSSEQVHGLLVTLRKFVQAPRPISLTLGALIEPLHLIGYNIYWQAQVICGYLLAMGGLHVTALASIF